MRRSGMADAAPIVGSCDGLGLRPAGSACVPPGSAGDQDAGKATGVAADAALSDGPPAVMKTPFEDDFEPPRAPRARRQPAVRRRPEHPAAVDPTASTGAGDLGPDWIVAQPGIWHIESGRLCGEHAQQPRRLAQARASRQRAHRVRRDRRVARRRPQGRVLGRRRDSSATALSYTNATSYLTIFGGWHNKFHVLARLNEHGDDRKEITVDQTPTTRARSRSTAGAELPLQGRAGRRQDRRSGGSTATRCFRGPTPTPLAGAGHDHFGFNDWDVKVCFDNVKVVPL